MKFESIMFEFHGICPTRDGQSVAAFPAKPSGDAMVFDEKGALWIVARDKVTQYVMKN